MTHETTKRSLSFGRDGAGAALRILGVVAACGVISALGCSSDDDGDEAADEGDQSEPSSPGDIPEGVIPTQPPSAEAWPPERFEIDDLQEDETLVLEPDGGRMQLQDGDGDQMAEFARTSAGAIEAERDEAFTAAVRRQREQVQIRDDPSEDREFDIRPRDTDDFQFRNAAGDRLAVFARDDDGWTAETAHGFVRFRVEEEGGETTLYDEDGEALYATEDAVDPLAFGSLGFDELSLDQRLALFLFTELERRALREEQEADEEEEEEED